MKKIILITLVSLIVIGIDAQTVKYKCTSKVKYHGMKLDTMWIRVNKTYQYLNDTMEKADFNVYADSMDLVNDIDYTMSGWLAWRGYATTAARRKDSLQVNLARKFGVNKNKMVEW